MEFRPRRLLLPAALVVGGVGAFALSQKDNCHRTVESDLAFVAGPGRQDFCNAIPYLERTSGRQITPQECDQAVQDQAAFLKKQKRCN
ncbi:MAG: hypothetical protein RLZZ283_673 [Candidatus Parcubacteria bacterium]|jgi:hypothetical protein